MTQRSPEEVARDIIKTYVRGVRPTKTHVEMMGAIASAIRRAVEAEREGCAETAEGVPLYNGNPFYEGYDSGRFDAATAIRARKEAP